MTETKTTTPTSHVFYQQGMRWAIDNCTQVNGQWLGVYGKKTLEQVRQERGADVQVLTDDECAKAIRESAMTDPVEITAERFDELLNVLPPCRWVRGCDSETFFVSEAEVADIHLWCARVGQKHYTLSQSRTMTHDQIVALVHKASAIPEVLV